MTPQTPFSGTGVAVVTPFDAKRQPDKAAIQRLTEHLVQGKVEYLVVLGSTGEAATLNLNEKQYVLESYLEANAGRLPVVVGAGGNDTREVCHQIEYFQKHYPQLSGILSVSPYYNKPSQEGIYRHYQALAAISQLPLILYNVPPRTGSNMTAETTLRLAHNHPNIVAMKEASGDMEQIMAIIKDKPTGFSLISGDDALTLPMVAVGAAGVISVVAHAAPFQFSEMVRAALAGKLKRANELHYQLWNLYKLAFSEGNPVSIKAILQAMGICEKYVRLPLVEGSQAIAERAKAMGL